MNLQFPKFHRAGRDEAIWCRCNGLAVTAALLTSVMWVAAVQDAYGAGLSLKRLDPAEGVVNALDEGWTYFENINVVFDQQPFLTDGATVTLEHNATGLKEEIVPNMMFSSFNNGGYTVLLLPSEEMNADGEYVMTIPADIFSNEAGEVYGGGTFTWTLTGLGGGSGDQGDSTPLTVTNAWIGKAVESGEKNSWGSEIMCVDPATALPLVDGITLSAIYEDDAIEVVFNHSEKAAEMSWQVYDKTADESVLSGWMYKLSNGHFTMSPGWIDIELFQGHEYALTFHAYNQQPSQGQVEYGNGVSITVYGDMAEFTFSDVYHIGTFPTPEAFEMASVDDNRVTMVFSGPVYIDEELSSVINGMGSTRKFEKVEYDRSNPNAVVLVIPQNVIASEDTRLRLSVAAFDYQDRLVEGNNGIDEESRIEASYLCNIASPAPVLTGDWHRVADTGTFRVKPERQQEYITDGNRVRPYLATNAGEKVAVFDEDYGFVTTAVKSVFGTEAPAELEFRLIDPDTNRPFVRTGNYKLVMPRGTFELGTGRMDHYASKNVSYPVEITEFVEINYIVAGHQTAIKPVAKNTSVTFPIKPAEGWVVDFITLNGEDITECYAEGVLTTPALNDDSEIAVEMNYDGYAYIPTGVNDVFSPLNLRVWSEDGAIHVVGLKAGQTVDLYSVSGARMFTEEVDRDGEATIRVPGGQVYILTVTQDEERVAVKINHN